jgi:kynurenine formamidase
VDFISISSLMNRDDGRTANRSFRERDFLVFEDMSLRHLDQPELLIQVIALPLRFVGGDGAPCSILGWVSDT